MHARKPLLLQCSLIRTSLLMIQIAAAASVQALETTVLLSADSTVQPGKSEVVTFGLPLPAGEVLHSSEIRVLQDGQELPVHVEPGLLWHWKDGSLRSVTIQLQQVDMTRGDLPLVINDQGRNVQADLQKRPLEEGWAYAGADKMHLPFPRVFALHDPDYLASSGLVPPYQAAQSASDAFAQLQWGQFTRWAGALDYSVSSNADWLFDRSTAMFKAYLYSGKVEFLKEAFLSKQFYFNHVRNDGMTPRQAGGDGCWTYGSTACADGKYIAPQQAKLAWALTGDDSQWDETLIINMALQADLGWNQHNTRRVRTGETEGFTERAAGLVGLAEINAFEMTGDRTVLQHLTERIAVLDDLQSSIKPWDQENGWLPKSGAFTHSWNTHEGLHSVSKAPLGVSDDRRFSPWMSENVADFLWQSYVVTGDERIPKMLRGLGNAIDLYGFASNYLSGSGLNAEYSRKAGVSGYNKCPGPDPAAVELMYSGSAYASFSALNKTHREHGFSDTHNIEVVLPLALAYLFEPSAEARVRLQARIEKILQQWTNNGARDCSTIFDGVHRLWNWQHRSNSIATWGWVRNESKGGQGARLPPVSDFPSGPQMSPAPLPPGRPMPNSGNGSPVGPVPRPDPGPEPVLPVAAALAFKNVTSSVIDEAPQVPFHFWAGMPDVNGDGCLDLFIGSHSDAVDSAMYLHKRNPQGCTGTFSHYPNNNNYSQAGPKVPRITSRYLWGNWYGHPQGLWSFTGADADGSSSARYSISASAKPGEPPMYESKEKGCFGARSKCLPLDIDGDGKLEMVSRLYSAPYNTGFIVDKVSGETLYKPDHMADQFVNSLVVFDVDNDGWPEVVNDAHGGYWRFDPAAKELKWVGEVFPGEMGNPTGNHKVVFDYNRDGFMDLMVGQGIYDKSGTFTFTLYRNNGDGSFSVQGEDATRRGGGLKNLGYWTTYANSVAADLDLDGYPDLLFGGESYRNNITILRNAQGKSVIVDRSQDFGRSYVNNSGKAWINVADYDNDGRIDIVKTHDRLGEKHASIGLFRNESSTGNHWMRVRVRGEGENTDGLHARLLFKRPSSEEILASYQVGAFSAGYQNLITHAGLGRATTVDLEVHYPHGGPLYKFKGLAADQDVVVFPDGTILLDYQPGTIPPLRSGAGG